MAGLNSNDLQKMKATEVANLSDIDAHAVRDEGFRRQTTAEKKIARLQKGLAAAQREMAEAGVIIQSALSELSKAA